jgi:BirA family biotin operon repressor/biotin-[acetyl-CoA-carboxylase] ligase
VTGFQLGTKAAARGYRLVGFDIVDSTSTQAAMAASAGESGPVWFAARRQTAGRGRRGRRWETPYGNLAASLLVAPDCDPKLAATLGFVAGVALSDTLKREVPANRIGPDAAALVHRRFELKWPNDVLADGRKLAGILLEAHPRQGRPLAVVIGFGVNVVGAPEGLPYPATSLAALGAEFGAEPLMAALSDAWVDVFEVWDNGQGVGDVLSRWRAAAAGIGAEIAVRRERDVLRGIFETIDDAGRLIVRGSDNSRIAITAGDVHFGVAASTER